MIATATATKFNRGPSEILKRVERGETMLVQKHGQPSAVLIPQPRITSGAELARRLSAMKPAPETASALETIIKGMNDAQ